MADRQLPLSHRCARARAHRQARQLTLLSGSSVLALMVAAEPALAGGPLGSWNAAGAAAAAAAAHASQGAQQAAAAAQQSSAAMSNAAAAIRNMWTTQAAARAAAAGAASRLTNGLGRTAGQSPGLVIDPRVTLGTPSNLWINVSFDPNKDEQTTNGITTVTIHETGPNAVATWEYFNVGPKTVVVFDQQGHANWTVINRVDGTGAPSEIAGQLKADGTLGLFNPNGFIFRAGSQTTVHSLLASSLDINSSPFTSVFTQASQSTGFSPNYVQKIDVNGATFWTPPNEEAANLAFAQNGLFPNGQGGAAGGNSAMFSLGCASSTCNGVPPGVGAIVVEAGASIASNKNLAGNGGYVALLGSHVANAGSIVGQNGQIILAAASSVVLGQPLSTATGTNIALTVNGLRPGDSTGVNNVSYAAPTNFPSLSSSGGGLVLNDVNGLLVSDDGAVTLAGDTIQQNGGIAVTTSVTRPGSITFDTRNPLSKTSGNVILGPSSVTAITPDEGSGTVPTGSLTGSYFKDNIQPKIAITTTGSVDIRSGALLSAPSAALTIDARNPSGTVLLETGSLIDLSGLTNVTLPMSMNEKSILVTANEVADDPLAQSLIGHTVTIDARVSGTRADGLQWVGSPILDAAGYVATIPKTIDELLTTGGSFQVTGPQNYIQQPGASINVSGGSVTYLGGMINTTKLLGADGRIYDIGSANPNIAYVGVVVPGQSVFDHAHWGVSEIFTSPFGFTGRFEAGYVSGRNAGSLNIAANVPILAGSISGSTVSGTRQNAGLDPLPIGASLNLTFNNVSSVPNPYNVALESQSAAGPDPYGLASFQFGSTTWKPSLGNNSIFPIFSDLLSAARFGSIAISGENQLNMPAGASLTVQPGGSISLAGVSSIDGALVAPSGRINLSGFAYGSGAPQSPPTPFLIIGPDAVIDARGRWVNDTGLAPDQVEGPAFINGGAVNISTLAASMQDATSGNFQDVTQSIVLAKGSVIDVSSGGYVASNGKIKIGSDGLPVGKGGSLTLTTYVDRWNQQSQLATFIDTTPTGTNVPNQANVVLGGSVYAGGFDGGGTFALQAPIVTIDGKTSTVTSYLAQSPILTRSPFDELVNQLPGQLGVKAATPAAHEAAGEIVLPTSFFASGFSQYTLTSTYGSTTVTAGTDLKLQQTSFLPSFLRDAPAGTSFATGALPRDFAPLGQALTSAGLLKPVSLTLAEVSFATAPAGDVGSSAGILIDSNATDGSARIEATAGATVSLVAGGPVTVLGSITAPAGTINVFNNPLLTDVINVSSPAAADVWIGDHAKLDVTGVIATNPLIPGSVTLLDGGTITLGGSHDSTVVVQQGAQLALGGASGSVVVPGASNLLLPTQVSTPVWSNGGTLQLAAGNIYFAGTVTAGGGAPNAAGGKLTIGNVRLPAAVSGFQLPVDPEGNLGGPDSLVIEPSFTDTKQDINVASAFAAPPSSSLDLNAMRALAQSGDKNGATSSIGFIAGGPTGTLDDSGFDSVSITAQTIAFAGSVSVNVPGALTLAAQSGHFMLLPGSSGLLPSGISDPTQFKPSSCTSAPCVGTVDLRAGYVHLIGRPLVAIGRISAPNLADGTLNVTADWIDLQRVIAVDDAVNVNFNSTGVIRLLPDNYGLIAETTSRPFYSGALLVPGNLSLTANEIVPVTDTQFLLMSLGTLANDSTLTVGQNGIPTAPLSAGGTVVLDAQKIVQGGAVWAPLGNVVVGLQSADELPSGLASLLSPSTPPTPTQSVVLTSGSLTSVSAAGLQIPFGYTVDGRNWYQGPTSANAGAGTPLTAPPAKGISLFGGSIAEASGATLDASGGGDAYATEFTAGTGGSRNVLTTYDINLALSTAVSTVYSAQYADGRQVYALVPSYEAKVAAYDPTFASYPYYSGVTVPTGTNLAAFTPGTSTPLGNAIAPGTSITISGGEGVAAGSYVLLPGMYATLPGAVRVVQVASNVSPVAAKSFFSDDGSAYITGFFGNALTGTRSALPSEFQLQSSAVWQRYSLITPTSATTFFRNQAVAAGMAVPPLPIDGGVVTVGATTTLKLDGSNDFAAAGTGQAGQLDISAKNILVIADDQQVPAGDKNNYLVLTSDLISHSGASAVLIGGTASFDAAGETITAEATNLEVLTDALHPLTGADLTLVTTAGGRNGLTVDQGSVIKAVGPVISGTGRNITIGSSSRSGDGAMLRVANGALVAVNRVNLPTAPSGKIAIGTAPGTGALVKSGSPAEIDGNALTIDTSGTSLLAANAHLVAKNYDLSGSIINVGNVPAKTAGLTLTPQLIANFAGAASVSLRSGSFFNFYDAGDVTFGDAAKPIGELTLSGSGIYHSGGNTTIEANNIVLSDSNTAPSVKGALTGTGGSLTINASGTLTIDVGTAVSTNKTVTMFLGGTGTGKAGNFGSFNTVDLTAADQIVFAGIGSSFTATCSGGPCTTSSGATATSVTTQSGILNAGPADVTLTASAVVVAGGSNQTFTTGHSLTLTASAGNVTATTLGGSLNLTAASIDDSGSIIAPSGIVTLTATTGGITLENGASISATGSAVKVLDQIQYAPGGSVVLVANAGDVSIKSGATIDVSAAGGGYAGSLSIQTPGTATLDGMLKGNAAFKDLGGNFSLTAGTLAENNSSATSSPLPFLDFTGSFAVTLAQGDIRILAGTTLTSQQVTLTANAGSVVVGASTVAGGTGGIIDASGPSGGQISLYGTGIASGGVTTGGVTIGAGAQLLARFAPDSPDDPASGNGTSNLVQHGGTITLGTTGPASGSLNATYGYENVASSGAITVAAAATLDVSGGPGGTVGPGGADISNTGGQVILRAPVLTDGTVNVHFNGTLVTNVDGNGSKGGGVVVDAYATWSTADSCTSAACAGQHFDGIIDPAGWFSYNNKMITRVAGRSSGDIFTPDPGSVYQPHVTFYQTTLTDFVHALNATADISGQLQIGSAMSAALPSSLVHMRPDIALVNPDAGTNGGSITVASNWNLGAGTFNVAKDKSVHFVPYYRTGAGEAGFLTLRATNNIAVGGTVLNSQGRKISVSATISDGFFETQDAFGGPSFATNADLVANSIANNPQFSGTGHHTVADRNTTAAASLMLLDALDPANNPYGRNNGSFSYDFVAGAAATPSANPNAVIPVASLSPTGLTGDVTIDGHTSYANSFRANAEPPTISIPSLVRTGTGNITVTAAGSFELLDQTVPGAIYTAGSAVATPPGFTAPTVPSTYTNKPNGLVGTPTWAAGGGSVSIATGQSIVGIETPTDDRGNFKAGIGGSHTGVLSPPGLPGGPTGQFWSDWYDHVGVSNGTATPFAGGCPTACQTAAWVNYATSFQGIGALGGGNITLKAGKDITDIGASLPETLVVSGGTSSGSLPQATYFGGGNLTVKAAGNINSSDFLVGRGTGLIEAGGNIQFDAKNPITGQMTREIDVSSGVVTNVSALPLLLAVQDGFITLGSRGSITVGNIYDPASLPLDATVVTPETAVPGASSTGNAAWSNLFTTFGPQSGVAIRSTAGDVTALTVLAPAAATGGLFVHNDQATVNDQGVTASTTGLMLPATLNVVALSGSVAINPIDVGTANLVPYPTAVGRDTGNVTIVAAKSIDIGNIAMSDLVTGATQFVGQSIGLDYTSYISPLGIPLSPLTQALHQNDSNPVVIAAGRDINAAGLATVSLIKPAQIEAGNDILGVDANNNSLTFVGENNNSYDITTIVAGRDLIGGNYALYGPGVFLLQAGRNMGPFEPSVINAGAVNGVAAIGNGTNVATAYGQNFAGRTYLPDQSADIYVLFGVAPGVNYQGAIDAYVNPAKAGTGGIDFLTDISALLGNPQDPWTVFQSLPPARQHLLIDRAFLDFLTQVANDYRDNASPYFGRFARAYTAIETMFPAAYGYTDNTTGNGNGAATTVQTGSLYIAKSVLETQMNSDINIIGPGGGITVGSAARDVLAPVQEGILTLAGGTIRAFTDGSILLNQSRILTLQGGDIDLFTANGDINAGEGPKTYVSDPPISIICDQSGYCHVNPSGLVSGAGIGALLTLPGQDQLKSSVTLVAPHGTVDAGAAGLRAGGGLNVIAQQVLNAYNVAATSVQGVPGAGQGSASSSTPAAPSAVTPAQQNLAPGTTETTQSTAQPSIILVEVIGYGGGDSGGGASDQDQEQEKQKR